MNEIIIDGIKFNYPSNWSDVASRDFLKIAEKFLLSFNVEEQEYIFLSAYIKKYFLKKIDSEILHKVCKTSLLFLKDFEFRFNQIPYFDYNFNRFYTLGKNLEQCTVSEYSYLDYFFWAYNTYKTKEYLNKFLAVIFKTKNEVFNPLMIDKKSNKMDNIPYYIKIYSLFYFNSCKGYIIDKFSNIFDTDSSSNEPPNWNSFIINLSINDASKIPEIEKLPIFTALYYRQESIKYNQNIEK